MHYLLLQEIVNIIIFHFSFHTGRKIKGSVRLGKVGLKRVLSLSIYWVFLGNCSYKDNWPSVVFDCTQVSLNIVYTCQKFQKQREPTPPHLRLRRRRHETHKDTNNKIKLTKTIFFWQKFIKLKITTVVLKLKEQVRLKIFSWTNSFSFRFVLFKLRYPLMKIMKPRPFDLHKVVRRHLPWTFFVEDSRLCRQCLHRAR